MEENQQKLSKARFAALEATRLIRENNAFARDVVESVISRHVLSSQDRAFARKLTLGVTQTKCTLNNMIYRCVDSPGDIQENVMDALRIAAYEIIYLEKEPYVAVDQGVELVKVVEKRARGLANLVLRRVVNLAKDFPFGNPDKDFDAFCRVYSVPRWMGDLFVDDLGEQYGKSLIASSNGRPPMYAFVNTLKVSVDEMKELLTDSHKVAGLNGVALKNCLRLDNPSILGDPVVREPRDEGKFIIADAASQAVVAASLLPLDNPDIMLEVGAGKGTKTLMFQILSQLKWNKQLDLFVLDNNQNKLNILRDRAHKAGVRYTNAICSDAADDATFEKSLSREFNGFIPFFDLVFVDAPCSGLGTLRRHPEIKWRCNTEVIKDQAKLGFSILCNSAKYVKDNGYLVYSTCSVTKQENQDVVIKFLETEIGKNFQLMQLEFNGEKHPFISTQTLAGLNDSHFCAVLKKVR